VAASLTDEQVRRAQDGDPDAAEALARAYLPRVHGLCARLLNRRTDLAEEATQEAFVAALRALPTLKEPAKLDGWLLVIAANAARRVGKRAARGASLSVDPAVEPDPVRHDDDPSRARGKAIDLAVASLDDDDRELFLLHTVEGLTLEALAKARRMTVSAMKARVHRARVKVRARAVRHLEGAGA
jgi:RNA polymerase sigma-70 factor (ECF subfamily)